MPHVVSWQIKTSDFVKKYQKLMSSKKKIIRIAIQIFLISIILLVASVVIIGGGFGDRTDYNLIDSHGRGLVFAHRGFARNNVENSIESFNKSDSLGFNAIESDISCTKDGKLIIFHDRNCMRLLGIDANIDEIDWADIKERNLYYRGKETKNKVITLEKFLQQRAIDKILYLDLKKVSKSIADSLLGILANYKEHKNIIIADGNLLFLSYIKYKNKEIRVALEGFNKGNEWIYSVIPRKMKPDYYTSFLSQVDENHMRFLKEHNLISNRITYGVDIKNLHKVYELGIQNIILDYDFSMEEVKNIESKLRKDHSLHEDK